MKNILLSIFAIFAIAGNAHAKSLADTNSVQFRVDHGNVKAIDKVGTELEKQHEHSIKCVYDYSVSGGSSAANISLLDEDGKPCVLPKDAIIRDVLIDVVTDPTSGGSATISLGSGVAANDFLTATAYGSVTGIMDGIPVNTAATAIKLASDKTPVLKIATAPLTEGKINVHIEYQISE